jgi:FMN phosphatase YigB (HAD superfamily)
MSAPRFLFFDVGNTLLFPNRAKMLDSIALDRHPTLEQWQGVERRTKHEFDRNMQDGKADPSFWRIFHTHLLEELKENTGFRDVLIGKTHDSANWDQIAPGTRASLERLRRKFRIAVISNADGGIERVLTRCGIADCFESITDSGIVGIEKPRREIFDAALAAVNARADESLYIGDVYSVDFAGAGNVGMPAVLFDVAGAYRDRDLPRVESLEQLEDWLA